jgi:DNA repair protein RecN (Recombination protein N)
MALLDLYGGHGALLADVQAAHAAVVAARAAAAAARAQAEADLREREWLEHAAAELSDLAPEPGEEERLATLRTRMQKDARLTEALAQVGTLVTGSDGALAQLRQAARRLERLGADDPGFAAILQAVDRALVAGDEIESGLEAIAHRALVSPEALEAAETRLFALRAAARKHRVGVDELPGLAAGLSARLEAIEGADAAIAGLDAACRVAGAALAEKAALLSQARAAAAARLDAAVNAELPALKLSSARFRTALSPAEPGPAGADRVAFEVATNRAAEFGPLTRIASGGELSRFVLALKVALAGAGVAGTLIFDEIDRGVGGAVASAIGDRLARLGGGENGAQLLVVTHSPQVAAAGTLQLLIEKEAAGERVRTHVRRLDRAERVGEIARMLSGTTITPEARAQAERLLAADT